jgi:hypothetical protein
MQSGRRATGCRATPLMKSGCLEVPLLKKYRGEGELVLTSDKGEPLVSYSLEDGKFARYDVIQSAWNRLSEKRGGKIRLSMKHLRKTSASLLGEHPQYKFYTTHFRADSPRHTTERHYVGPSDAEFFEALDRLRGRILAEGVSGQTGRSAGVFVPSVAESAIYRVDSCQAAG